MTNIILAFIPFSNLSTLWLGPGTALCSSSAALFCIWPLLFSTSVLSVCLSQLSSPSRYEEARYDSTLNSTQLHPAKFVASSSFLCIYYYLLSDDPKLLFCFCFPHIWSSLWFSEMGFFLICKKDLVLIFCVSASFWVLFSNALPFAKAHFFRDCSPDLYR